MTVSYRFIAEKLGLLIIFLSFSSSIFAQIEVRTLKGTVVDETGSFVVGAELSIATQNGEFIKKTLSDKKGKYAFNSLVLGKYSLIVSAVGFAKYQNRAVTIDNQKVATLDIQLKVGGIKENVSVGGESNLSADLQNNLDAMIITEKEIASLPDDTESLTAMLQALAGPSAGLGGAQILVDGFSGGEVPPKDTIREIRINQNPFSAEFERPGHGRIQIFTKPGTGRFHMESSIGFSDESLNSRSPFTERKVSDQTRNIWGYFSHSLIKDKLSYGAFFDRSENDQNKVIRANSLDSSLSEVSINRAFPTPRRSISFDPRIDYQVNKNHTLSVRYGFSHTKTNNSGVGDLSLPSRAFDLTTNRHTFRFTETAIINENLVSEIRFQYINTGTNRNGIDSSPSLNVFGAFSGGGSPIGEAFDRQNRWEFTNIFTWTMGNHAIRTGGRIRGININNISPQNFNGTYSFAGGVVPRLNQNSDILTDDLGQPVLISITSLERYRRTLLLQQLGFTSGEIRSLGAGATQFSLAAGNPQARVNQIDFGGFIQDDWRIKPNFTVGLGLRYEAQTNVSNNLNVAPRVAFAWSPKFGSKKTDSKMVIRGGFGIFFSRVGANLTLQKNRFNGVNQQQFIVSDPLIVNSFPNVPTIDILESFTIPQTIRSIANDIRSPYTMQSSFSLERRLPMKINFVATFVNTRILNLLRSRNISVQLPNTSDLGNNYSYESSGIFKQKQLMLRVRRSGKKLFWSANYTFSKAESDTDGANSFPANSFDLSNEFGRSSLDIRHRFTLRSFLNLPGNMYLNAFVMASSGTPFNITTGQDTNGDSLFMERPAFATDLTGSSVVETDLGNFDINPLPNQTIIPRNVGSGPNFFSVNLGLFKTFGVGRTMKNMVGKHHHRGDSKRAYNLTFGVTVNNIFNNVNFSSPVGNLSSPLFGQSTSTLNGFGFSRQRGASTNRRLNFSLRISY